MNDIMLLLIQSLWFIAPAYIANPTPVIAGGGTPIDFGKKFCDGEPILGKGKTWRGAIIGILAGTIMAWIQTIIQPSIPTTYGLMTMTISLGLVISTGALVGDMIKSFFKRRMKIKRGEKWPIIDQVDFIIGAVAFAALMTPVPFKITMTLLIITPLTHRAANILAYKLKLKKVPW